MIIIIITPGPTPGNEALSSHFVLTRTNFSLRVAFVKVFFRSICHPTGFYLLISIEINYEKLSQPIKLQVLWLVHLANHHLLSPPLSLSFRHGL